MQYVKGNDMLLYAVIDTNVLVSAFLKENSIPRYVINTMYAGNIIPIYNAEIIAEQSVSAYPSIRSSNI